MEKTFFGKKLVVGQLQNFIGAKIGASEAKNGPKFINENLHFYHYTR